MHRFGSVQVLLFIPQEYKKLHRWLLLFNSTFLEITKTLLSKTPGQPTGWLLLH